MMAPDPEMTTFKLFPVDRAAREFHISRKVRAAYGLSDTLFSVTGNVVFADFRAARELAHRLNEQRDVHHHPERAVRASRLYALGLIDEVLHLMVARHRQVRAPRLWAQVLSLLSRDLGSEKLNRVLETFVDEFPPVAVYRGETGADAYLAGATDGVPHREIVVEELVLLWLANRNPAFSDFRELFDDATLRRETDYEEALEHIETILGGSATGLGGLAAGGVGGETLLERLYAPMRAAPTSLEGQLAYIRGTWAELLGPELHRVLGGLDFIAEEQRVFFPPGPGPGSFEPQDYAALYDEVENYSADLDWMPRLVLLAKNAHVWLAQLSRKYGREITTLDAVPDAELAEFAGSGFTGLWLIGVWERSRASERIKRRMGDEDAVASAYSLKDYRIADVLGGESAYDDLRTRAWRHGIRLSTDMVPNHMGIDSHWVINHPDWFLSVDRSPYPSYEFNGPDLSDDDRVGVFIEDKYWSKTDAAVVFKRLDRHTGSERYIYHGNDGTSMPWNDTAQLDYTRADVREAVIQTILAVARRSPVIRFDAAMTLTRQNYHRLWFPEPGAAGAVPSRSEFGMSRAEFDAVMPHEFWREVVDRVAAEAPDTLLLAEAFWLLEGYFVRTLGMHRVYNSAFMNMLRDERNAEYRQLIRTTLEFDPQILKRYVNFMSNPDERTAVDQFGTGDKYFGVSTMMATMPGLPMFGHGQVEGLAEKYGMEFRRPRWDETADEGLVARHGRQLFPLLRRRRLFAEVGRFRLYDFVRDDSSVDENVFAYSNEVDGDRSLVVFHNRHADTRGWIRLSTGVADEPGNPERPLVRTTLGDGLRLPDGPEAYLILRDAVTSLEYLRSCRQLRDDGMRFDLGAYQLHCFVALREVVSDEEHPWAELAAELDGIGVRSVDEVLGVRVMAPVLDPIRRLLEITILSDLVTPEASVDAGARLREVAAEEVAVIVAAAAERAGFDGSLTDLEAAMLTDLEALLAIALLVGQPASRVEGVDDAAMAPLGDALVRPERWAAVLMWIVARHLGRLEGPDRGRERARARYVNWHLGLLLGEVAQKLGVPEDAARALADAVELMILSERRAAAMPASPGELAAVFEDPVGRRFLAVNTHREIVWFNRERFVDLVGALVAASAIRSVVVDPADAVEGVARACDAVRLLIAAAEASDFQVVDFLAGRNADADGEPATDRPDRND